MHRCNLWNSSLSTIYEPHSLHFIRSLQGRVRLDVGGTIYTTSLLTLTQDPESMLAAMFSGRHQLQYEADGTIFIDRDGQHFRYILNYLRDGCLKGDNLPRNRQILRELRNEAIYFQLHGLLLEIEKLTWFVFSDNRLVTNWDIHDFRWTLDSVYCMYIYLFKVVPFCEYFVTLLTSFWNT